MNIGKAGLDLIKKYEGCDLHAYRCPSGILTVGWGHTGNVKEGQVITRAQADELLVKDLQKFVKAVNNLIKVPLNQNQFDALVCFTYNCGEGALEDSSLRKLINQGKFETAALEFAKWNKGTVKGVKTVLLGLTRRRESERALFVKPVSVILPKKPVQKETSLVDYLQSHGKPTDFASRKKLAESKGIKPYEGTADQNVKLLNILQK